MVEVSDAVKTVVGRMETNPSEFFQDAYKWRFVFNALFLDALTDAEKTALNDGMTHVRRAEFNSLVMHAALNEPIETGIVDRTVSGAKYIPTIQKQQAAITASQYNAAQQAQRAMLNNAGTAQQYNAAQQASHLPLQNAMAGQGQNIYGLANSNGIK